MMASGAIRKAAARMLIDPAHLRLDRMATGQLSLVLREGAAWSEFATFATEFLALCDGQVLSRADSPVERVWSVRIRGQDFWLAYDDWHGRYELDARSTAASAVAEDLAAELARGS
jgi:Protein of unknown function (DUF3630)